MRTDWQHYSSERQALQRLAGRAAAGELVRSFLEHFPYRQLHMVWRLEGLCEFMRGDLTWKPLKRQGRKRARGNAV